jgi:DNA-binding GntR family transcriptional regulator
LNRERPRLQENSNKNTPLSIREKTYNHLKARVLAGAFTPGERLIEEQLAEDLGVSRTPIREALHTLELEGLVKPLETRGFYVSRDSREEMEDLFDIRSVLEGYALRIACERMDEETLARLEAIIQKAEEALQRESIAEVFDWNTQFHDTLHQLVVHKPRLHQLMVDMRMYVLRYRKDTLHHHESAQRTIDGHRKLILALGLGDPDLCERLMRQHIEEAKEDALRMNFEPDPGLAGSPDLHREEIS